MKWHACSRHIQELDLPLTSMEEMQATASSKQTVTSSDASPASMCIPPTRMQMDMAAEVCNR